MNQMWSKVIYRDSGLTIQEASLTDKDYREHLTKPVAEGLYADICRVNAILNLSDDLHEPFDKLSDAKRSFWYDYADQISDKLKKMNLFIRQFEDFCRTCLITDKEIVALVQMDLLKYCRELTTDSPALKVKKQVIEFSPSERKSAYPTVKDWNKFSLELNYLIPAQMKKIGYEIIRQEEAEEINMPVIKKLARAIHAKYLHELRTQSSQGTMGQYRYFTSTPDDGTKRFSSDFEDLPEDIKYSNIDNAAHIPTKLLAIGYKIRQVKKGFKPVTLHLNTEEIETMSMVEHIRWSWDKRLNGWTCSDVKDDVNKTHPGLKPYHDLPESEKEKDRELVRLIPSLLNDIDFEAYPIDKRHIRNLPYTLKPQSIIHKILNETREMNDHIRSLVTLSPSIDEMVSIRNRKIEEAIREIEASYNYAQHIQETFLPDDLYIRECFPDSFILFKPKDIVSGDFYFFSRRGHLTIFAAADCTGHGIPGALLSTIGYGTLDQAVNEVNLTDPSSILHHLYSKIHRFLHNDADDTGISDDMDIVLCILDTRTNILTYAGVKNPLYRISNGELFEYRANNSPEDYSDHGESSFTSEMIPLRNGDIIYLCSDGYVDQFGGRHHKKYQRGRFKVLLQNIQQYSMPEQSDLIYEEIEQWRDENNEDQTDDILVIGIRI
jgi:serine phosphatase RsbU (regulator of sigma subunit)